MIRDLLLFLLVSGLSGVAILVGSILGNAFGKAGLFAGAVVGGLAGIAAGLIIARTTGLLEGAGVFVPLLFAILAFGVAAVIAVYNLSGPIVPIASTSLIGIGAVAGKKISLRRS